MHGFGCATARLRAGNKRQAARRTGPASAAVWRHHMRRYTILALAIVLAVPLTVRAQESDAKKLAQEILDKGAALFDTHDATAMAATYTDDAQLELVEKDNSTAEVKITVKKDRPEIETFYRDVFKDAKEKTTSRNTVEFARFVAPDIMIIEGLFQPDVAKEGKYPFVQLRAKQAEKWVIKSLQFYLISQE
jgi:hypothetical protein